MKGKRFVPFFVFMCILLLAGGLSALETKLSMELWSRMTSEKVGDKIPSNYLSLERGYLGLEPTLSDKVKGRFTVDIFSSDETYDQIDKVTDTVNPVSADSLSYKKKATVDGAGLKIKYAYLDYVLSPLADYVPDTKLQFGLIKTYFGTIYDWEYATIDKDPVDKYKLANSTDYGVAMTGYLPRGYGEYAVALYNGEGYKKSLSLVNNEYAYAGNLRLTPVTGVMVGGSFLQNSVNNDKKNNTPTTASPSIVELPNASYQQISAFAGVAKLSYRFVDLWGELLSQTVKTPNVSGSKDVKSQGFMAMPVLHLNALTGRNIDLLVRYDSYDGNTDKDKDQSTATDMLYTTTTLGLNWNMLCNDQGDPAVMLQANYAMKKYEKEIVNSIYDTDTFMLQLRWKFSNVLN